MINLQTLTELWKLLACIQGFPTIKSGVKKKKKRKEISNIELVQDFHSFFSPFFLGHLSSSLLYISALKETGKGGKYFSTAL